MPIVSKSMKLKPFPTPKYLRNINEIKTQDTINPLRVLISSSELVKNNAININTKKNNKLNDWEGSMKYMTPNVSNQKVNDIASRGREFFL